jgi:phosphotransferase system  glucose/maltose/N-acetylglucosamine-specific IIC component
MPSFYNPVLPLIPLLFYGVTNLVHYYLLRVAVKKEARFTAQYMAASFIKMFFYMVVAIGYAFINKEQAKIFLINFLLLYIIYTTFEVVELTRVIRQNAK